MNADLNKTHPSRKWRKMKEIRSTKAFEAEGKRSRSQIIKKKGDYYLDHT